MSDHEHAPAPEQQSGRPPIHYHHITVLPIDPPVPLVVCSPGFITELAKVEREIAHLEIVDDATLQEAAAIQNRLTKAGKVLEETRAKLKAPFIAKGKEIDAAAKRPGERIESAKEGVGAKLVAYRQRQQELAEKAERERLAELERLQKKLEAEAAAERKRIADLAAEVERKRVAAEKEAEAARLAGLPPVVEVDFGDDDEPAAAPLPLTPEKTETEKAIEAVRFAPAVSAAKPEGIRYVTKLIHTVTDVAALPDMFVIRTAKDAAIRAAFCVGWKEGEPLPTCPGVNFKIQRDAQSTGKGFEF
jgi:hypothetical protein